VLGNNHLGPSEHLLEMTDAERGDRQEIKDAQTGLVAQTLVDLDQLHKVYISQRQYKSTAMLCAPF